MSERDCRARVVAAFVAAFDHKGSLSRHDYARAAIDEVCDYLMDFIDTDEFDAVYDLYDSGEVSYATSFRMMIEAALKSRKRASHRNNNPSRSLK